MNPIKKYLRKRKIRAGQFINEAAEKGVILTPAQLSRWVKGRHYPSAKSLLDLEIASDGAITSQDFLGWLEIELEKKQLKEELKK